MKFLKLNIAFKKIDWLLICSVGLLMILGLILIYSVALGSQSEQNFLNLKKQIVFLILGFLIAIVTAVFIDYRILLRFNIILYIFGVLLLISVLIFGKTIRGTTGWYDFGWFSFQPVELIKIILIIFLSKYFADKAKYLSQFKYLILSSSGVFLLVLLVAIQPDFGSALILFSLWGILILLTGIKKNYLFLLTIILILSSLILWFFVFQDYQKQRIMVFIDPSLDPLGSGYNVTQATIAIGSGHLWGKGLTFGSQSQLKFLPESQTDFIFAVLSEELGFAGVVFLIVLFVFLFYRLLSYVKKINDNFAAYLLVSICALFVIQTIVNIGGNLGLLPITGITLPFVSYGGSSLVVNCFLIGLIESVIIRN